MLFLFLSLVLAGAFSPEQAPQADTQPGQVSGQVVEQESGAPISGASVMLYALERSVYPSPPPQARTDQGGRFVIEGLAPGRYRLNVQKPGYASPLPPDPLAYRTVEIAAGQTLGGVNISLARGAVITGQILDPISGEPLVGSMVMVMKRPFAVGGPEGAATSVVPRLMPVGQGVQTNDLGEFRIFGLPTGEYFVAASGPSSFGFAPNSHNPAGGFDSVFTYYPGVADAAAAQPVTLAAGQIATGIVFRILRAQTYQVSGIVVDGSGATVAGATVFLRGDPRGGFGAWPAGSANSDANGRFVIGGVTPGSYLANASLPIKTDSPAASSAGVGAFSVDLLAQPLSNTSQNVTVMDADVEGLQIVVQ